MNNQDNLFQVTFWQTFSHRSISFSKSAQEHMVNISIVIFPSRRRKSMSTDHLQEIHKCCGVARWQLMFCPKEGCTKVAHSISQLQPNGWECILFVILHAESHGQFARSASMCAITLKLQENRKGTQLDTTSTKQIERRRILTLQQC